MPSPVSCPVDNIRINENQVRVTAGLVLLLGISWVVKTNAWVLLFMGADFLLRSLNLGRFSILNMFSRQIVELFELGNKPVDRAPKRFAAIMGTGFTFLILLLSLTGLHSLAMVTLAVLLAFAFLESFLAFCAGCYVYQFIYPKR